MSTTPVTGGACQEGPLWTVQHAAAHRGVTAMFYRRNILTLDGHPAPLDPAAKRIIWWREHLEPWLDDADNLVRDSDKWHQAGALATNHT